MKCRNEEGEIQTTYLASSYSPVALDTNLTISSMLTLPDWCRGRATMVQMAPKRNTVQVQFRCRNKVDCVLHHEVIPGPCHRLETAAPTFVTWFLLSSWRGQV